MTILVIEDDVEIRQTLQDLLELNGYAVTAVGDGPAGVAEAQHSPELILCDIGLPGLDGYEVLSAIRKFPQCVDIPFIFLTARADRDDQRRGMVLGADDYIIKPFTEKDIIDALESRLRRLQPLRSKIDQLINEQRSVIGANWSHELMTPLNAVLGGLELLEMEADEIDPDELREVTQIIRSGAVRQQELSQKLVLYFELQRARELPVPGSGGTCNVAIAVKAGAARATELEHRAQDLTMNCSAGEVGVYESHLKGAIAELVGNAFRFSSPGQPVTVTGTQNADRYLIDIVDEGIGMSAEEISSVGSFMQFGRKKLEQQGLGLGLAIAKLVAEIGGGKLEFQQRPGGVGLCVRLDLPLV